MLLGAIDKLNTIDGDVVEAVIADMAHDEEEASRQATTAPSSRAPAPAALAVSRAEKKIGSAQCRGRVCQYEKIPVGALSLYNNQTKRRPVTNNQSPNPQ